MNNELKEAVIKALQKNHKNGPMNARNLAGIFSGIIEQNQQLSAEKIADLINEAEAKSENEDDHNDDWRSKFDPVAGFDKLTFVSGNCCFLPI